MEQDIQLNKANVRAFYDLAFNQRQPEEAVKRYLEAKFGDALDDARAAMRKLAAAHSRETLEEAGMTHKLDLRLAPAHKTLDALLESGAEESFDFCFIDADKENYVSYYDKCLRLVRHGGLIAVDNALWGGAVASAAEDDEETRTIRELNRTVAGDERVTHSLVPIGDGLLLARRR